MNRHIVVGLLPLVLITGSMTLTSPAGATAPAAPTVHISAKQRAQALHAADSPLLVRGRAHRGAAAPTSTARVVIPHQSKPFLAALKTPTLVFTRYNNTGLTIGLQSKNLLTGVISTLIPLSSSICPISPRLSPDSTLVTYVNYGPACSSGGEVDVLDVATASVTTLATAATDTFLTLPNFSADGGTVLYTLETDDVAGNFVSSSLFTVPAAGGSSTAVAGGGLAGYDGVFSPDGNKIVYAPTDQNSDNFLAVMNANGSSSTVLASTELSAFSPLHPSWSPDGTKVSFTYVKFTGGSGNTTFYINGIGVAKVDDSAAAGLLVTSASQTNAFYSSWSADGTEIFYDALQRLTTTGANNTNAVEYVTDAAGHRRATLVAGGLDAYDGVSFGGDSPSIGSASSYTPVAPTRVLAKTPVGPGAVLNVQVAGSGPSFPAPVGATAVTINLTGVTPTAPTYLQVYPKPSTGTVPLVSNLNLVTGQIAAVAVQVPVSSDGFIRIRNNAGTTGVIVDVSGYFSDGRGASLYTPITPVRAKDATLGIGGTTDVTVTGLGAANPGFTPVAVVLNLTGASPTANTYLSAYPTPAVVGPPPTVSNVNLSAHTTRANLVTVQIGDTGRVTIRNAFGSMRTIVDVVGYYGTGGTGGLAYFPLQPTRVMDTRNGTGTYVGSTAPLGVGATIPIDLRGSATTGSGMITVPATALAYVYNLTAVGPTGNTFVTAYPFGGTLPVASSLNAAPGTTVPNLAITGTDSAGNIGLFNSAGKTPLLIDLAGYYAP